MNNNDTDGDDDDDDGHDSNRLIGCTRSIANTVDDINPALPQGP